MSATKKLQILQSRCASDCDVRPNIMKCMSDKEIETLINLLRWLENKGCIIIVENNIDEVYREIRSFNPGDDIYSTYQSLNSNCKVNPEDSPLTEMSAKSTPKRTIKNSYVKKTPILKKKRRKRTVSNPARLAKKRRKEKQEKLALELALAEATRGNYIGDPPKPHPNAVLLLRRKSRPITTFSCIVTSVPAIKPPPSENPPSPPIASTPEEPQLPPQPKQSFPCEQCPKILKTKPSFKSHMVTHLNLQSLICEKCGKTFNHRRGLQRHLVVHDDTSNRRKHGCDTCSSTFAFPHQLKHHKLMHSTSTTVAAANYKCDVCHRQFPTKKHLLTHSVVHSDNRPFQCSSCGRTFRRSSHLVQHTRIHSGVKPFKCEKCGKGWVQQANLVCHLKNHHKMETENQSSTAIVIQQMPVVTVECTTDEAFTWKPQLTRSTTVSTDPPVMNTTTTLEVPILSYDLGTSTSNISSITSTMTPDLNEMS